MNIFIIILVAFAPCVFWLWLILRGHKYEPEPKSLLIRTFFLGLAIGVPVAVIEGILYPKSLAQNALSLPTAAYVGFIVAGVTEESAKFLVVRRGVYSSRFFKDPYDGLIYPAAAALGFASLENVGYMLSFGWNVILARGLVSNLAHVLFASLWGYPLSLHKLAIIKSRYIVWFGLISAMLAHGVFDFLTFLQSNYSLLNIPLFIGMVVLFIYMVRNARRVCEKCQ